jgi:hypothetical protein
MEKKSSSFIGWFINMIFVCIFTIGAFKSSNNIGIFVMITFFCFYLSILFLFKKIIITEETTTLKWYWTNKLIWEINNNEIEKINATYYSDSTFRSKTLYFNQKKGTKHKTYIYGTTIEDIAKLYLKRNKTPFYIEKNGKFEKYKLPKYN